MNPKTVSFINLKGGVGKTTLAMQLALAADQRNLRTLAIDLDPQSNLSQSLLGARRYRDHLQEERPTVIQLFEGYLPAGRLSGSPQPVEVEDTILKSVSFWKDSTLDLIPCRLELCRTLRNPTGKERKLAKAIAKISANYDLIIIDCAPTDSILTDAAYFSSRYIMIPIKPEYMATIGLPLLARSLESFRKENEDHSLDVLGLAFVHSSYDRGPESRQAINEVTGFASGEKWPIFENHILYSKSFARSARESRALCRTKNVRLTTAASFEKFQREFFEKLGFTL